MTVFDPRIAEVRVSLDMGLGHLDMALSHLKVASGHLAEIEAYPDPASHPRPTPTRPDCRPRPPEPEPFNPNGRPIA